LKVDEDFGVFGLSLWGIRNFWFWGWGGWLLFFMVDLWLGL